MQQISHHSAVI